MHMYKAQSFHCDICGACGEALSQCRAPRSPKAKYGALAAYIIQPERRGNQRDAAPPHVTICCCSDTLPKVTPTRATASEDEDSTQRRDLIARD